MIVQVIIFQIVASFSILANPLGENDNIEYLPEINASCAGDFDCALLPHSACINNTCTCSSGYIVKDGKCRGDIYADCSNSSDCGIENSMCLPVGICACRPNHYYEFNRCIPFPTNVYDECSTDDFMFGCYVIPNSECINHRCVCRDGYTVKNGKCHK